MSSSLHKLSFNSNRPLLRSGSFFTTPILQEARDIPNEMETRGLEPQRSSLACASFGGPMAVIRDDPKIVQLHAECALRKLCIFNSAGLLLSETVWNWKHPGGRLTEMSWSDDQTLLGIVQAGTVYRYNIHPELVGPNVSMGKECFEENVVECVFWGNGVVCLTEGGEFRVVLYFGFQD